MRKGIAAAALVWCVLSGSCAPTPSPQTDPDLPREYELHLHDHDRLCAIDPSAPGLQSCMTFAEFQGFLHSVRAEVEP